MSDNIAMPVIVGLAIGIAFVTLFAFTFHSITPIPIIHNKPPPPLPEIKMMYSGSEYTAQATTFGWERDMLYIGNVSDVLSYQNNTVKMKQDATLDFTVSIYNDTASALPVKAVYVYEYPTNDFAGILQRLDEDETGYNNSSTNGSNNVYMVDLENGDYYLRVNYQSDSGSVSYYFRVSVDMP